jgi:hypothetical protein
MDVAGEKARFKSVMKRVNLIDESDRRALLRFYKRLRKDRVGHAKITNHLKILLIVRGLLGKPLGDASEDDVFNLVERIEGMDYSESTKAGFRATVKRFYGYSWIKSTEKKNKMRLPSPEELLSEEEVMEFSCQALIL